MTEYRFSADDVIRAVAAPAPRGAHYANGRTDLYIGRTCDTAVGLMIARHEETHYRLSAHTSFGRLVWAVYDNVTRTGGDPARLLALVDAMRRAQEVAATAIGLWATTDREDLLSGFPDYATFLKDAKRLSRGLPYASYGAAIVVEQACRAALQVPLLHWIPDPGQWGALALEDLPESFRPDVRFQALLESDIAIGDTVEPASGARLASIPAAAGTDEREFMRWSHGQSEWAFNYAAAILRRSRGYSTASFNGHVLEATDIATLDQPSAMLDPARAARRIHFSDRRWQCTVTGASPERLATAAPHAWLLVVRPLRRILDQYALAPEDTRRLRKGSPLGVVTALRRVAIQENQLQIELVVFETPEHLTKLSHATSPFVASISAAAVASDWGDAWMAAIDELPFAQTILIDTDLDRWIRRKQHALLLEAPDIPTFEASNYVLAITGGALAGLACLSAPNATDPAQSVLYCVVCDPDSAVSIARLWREQLGAIGGEDRPESAPDVIAWLGGHLIYGEPWFDLDASAAPCCSPTT